MQDERPDETTSEWIERITKEEPKQSPVGVYNTFPKTHGKRSRRSAIASIRIGKKGLMEDYNNIATTYAVARVICVLMICITAIVINVMWVVKL